MGFTQFAIQKSFRIYESDLETSRHNELVAILILLQYFNERLKCAKGSGQADFAEECKVWNKLQVWKSLD